MFTVLSRLIVKQCRSRSFSICDRLLNKKDLSSTEDNWKTEYCRGVPKCLSDMNQLTVDKVESPSDSRLLKVAIVGVPNSGKSTLINQLIGWRVCSVSSKVHTTQCNAKGVFVQGQTQVVFLDTPGLVSQDDVERYNLSRNLMADPERSLQSANLLAVVHDMSLKGHLKTALNERVLRLLALFPTVPAVLVLNKIDRVKCKRLLLTASHILTEGVVGGRQCYTSKVKRSKVLNAEQMILHALQKENFVSTVNSTASSTANSTRRNFVPSFTPGSSVSAVGFPSVEDLLTGKTRLSEHQATAFVQNRVSWPGFSDLFMVSALDGSGVSDLKDFLVASARPSPWVFSEQVVTDQNPHQVALQAVREKFLDAFKNEIPYRLKYEVEFWDVSQSDVISIVVRVTCSRSGLMKLLIGGGGCKVSPVARAAEQELRDTFRTEVRLRLNVVCKDPRKLIQ